VAVIVSDHPHNPYVQQYTFSVEREVFKATTVEVNYIGNRAVHLLNRVNENTPPQLTGTQLANCQAAFAAADATAYAANSCGWTFRKPLPNFGGPGLLNSVWNGYSNYNAGNVKIERRAADMALLAVYTYAKSMDDKSAPAGIGANGSGFAGHMNDLNPRLDYAPSDFSVRHRFVASAVYGLPFGRGKHFLGGANWAEDLAVGGWQLSVISTFQTGFPFSVNAPDLGLAGNPADQSFGQRAIIVGRPQQLKKPGQWFNTTAFSQTAFGLYGNSGRNIFTQPGINNWDTGLAKTFQFTERVGFQFRVESFNTFNHTQYGADPTQPGIQNGSGSVSNNITNGDFGRITTARPARVVQLGGKLSF
jgi:hypothetical protein